MKGWVVVMALLMIGGLAEGGRGAERPEADPYFAKATRLELKSTRSLGVVSMAKPTFFGPSSLKPGHSFYVCGIGQIHEVRMDTGELIRHDGPERRGVGYTPDLRDLGQFRVLVRSEHGCGSGPCEPTGGEGRALKPWNRVRRCPGLSSGS